ncbi:hemerythrin domain-containing protein [Streptomyces flavidovirens]|uniref:hemerythrin domain-containing protein n=1 Tax=Streptomyces flavidovirens TaxID=67298 RepID=UPI00041AB9E2|nr:hemerythrin domain-containing protein [Streptomyces flavidovirens]
MSASTLPGTPPAPRTPTAGHKGNNLTGFTLTHDLIRRAVPELGRRLANAASDGALDPAAVTRLTTWWGMFTTILDGHHTSEDSHVWPVVLAADPALETVSRTLEQQHASLDGHLAGIHEGLRLLRDNPGSHEPGLSHLLARIAEFDALMYDHLQLEERTMVPVLRDRVTGEAYAAMLASLASGHDPADFVPTMPLLLEQASQQDREFMLGGMPAELRTRYEQEWEPAYSELLATLPAA